MRKSTSGVCKLTSGKGKSTFRAQNTRDFFHIKSESAVLESGIQRFFFLPIAF